MNRVETIHILLIGNHSLLTVTPCHLLNKQKLFDRHSYRNLFGHLCDDILFHSGGREYPAELCAVGSVPDNRRECLPRGLVKRFAVDVHVPVVGKSVLSSSDIGYASMERLEHVP